MQFLVLSLADTRAAFKQLLLQLFQWPHRSQKLGKVYLLLRKFFEDCIADVYQLSPHDESLRNKAILKRHSLILAKDIALLCCSACNIANYLVKLRASYTLSMLVHTHLLGIVFETCGEFKELKDLEMCGKLEETCLGLVRGMSSLKAVALKLATYFEDDGSRDSRWTWELLRLLGVCKSTEYRKVALNNLAVSNFTLPYILLKMRDTSSDVRAAVYGKLLHERVRVTGLSPQWRFELLLNGLLDSNDKVRQACQKYLAGNLEWGLETSSEDTKASSTVDRPSLHRRFKSDAAEAIDEESAVTNLKPAVRTSAQKAVELMKLFGVKELLNDSEYSICVPPLAEFALDQCERHELCDYFHQVVCTLTTQFASSCSKTKNAQKAPAISAEGLVLLRTALELATESNEGSRLTLEDIEPLLPAASNVEQILQYYISNNDLFVVHELLLLLQHYNHVEPKINQVLVGLLDKILKDVNLDSLPSPGSESCSSSKARKKKRYSQPKKTQGSEQLEAAREEYEQLVSDQLDLHRRDVIVRNMGDIIYIVVRVLKVVTAHEDNRFEEHILMLISDLQEQIEDTRARHDRLLKALDSQDSQELEARHNAGIDDAYQLECDETLLVTRALKLAVSLLQTCKTNLNEATLQALNDSLVAPALQQAGSNELIKFLAIEYLGLYALMDRKKCLTLFPIFKGFVSGLSTCQTLEGIAALKGIFDSCMVHRLCLTKAPVHEAQSQATTHEQENDKDKEQAVIKDILGTLSELRILLYAPNPQLRLLAYECFAKLIFCDKIPNPQGYLTLLILVLGDPSEDENEVAAIKQIITLALKNYSKLSERRGRKLSAAIVVYTWLWMKSQADPGQVSENSILSRILNSKHATVISYLLYILTRRFMGNELAAPFVVEILIHLLKLVVTHIGNMRYLQPSLAVCLHYVELEGLTPPLLLVLYKHWKVFIEHAPFKEKEYYTFVCALRFRIAEGHSAGPISPEGCSEAEIDAAAGTMAGELRPLCERLEKHYEKIERISERLFQEYNEMCIDRERGCTIHPKVPHNRVQSGMLTDRKSATLVTQHFNARKTSRLETILETPRDLHKPHSFLTAHKRKRDTSQRKDPTDHRSKQFKKESNNPL